MALEAQKDLLVIQGQLIDGVWFLLRSDDVNGVVSHLHLIPAMARLVQLHVLLRTVVPFLVINLEHRQDILGQDVLGLHKDLPASPGAGSLGTYVVQIHGSGLVPGVFDRLGHRESNMRACLVTLTFPVLFRLESDQVEFVSQFVQKNAALTGELGHDAPSVSHRHGDASVNGQLRGLDDDPHVVPPELLPEAANTVIIKVMKFI